MRRCQLLAVLVAVMVVVGTSSSFAQWQEGGTVMCTANGYQYRTKAVTDGCGGAIIAWSDYRTRTGVDTADIYIQRVDNKGNALWGTSGVAVCALPEDQRLWGMISDGQGGAILTWHDYRNGVHHDIYAQRVDASGNMMWPANGALVCGSANDQLRPVIATDDAGGAFIAWYDYRGGGYDIYAQRMNGSGMAQWTPNGLAVCTAADNQYAPLIAQDGGGGAIIAWKDWRNGNEDIYAERIDASGNPTWGIPNGSGIVYGEPNQRELEAIAYDGFGGVVLTFWDRRASDYDLYAFRMTEASPYGWDFGDGMPVVVLPSSAQWQSTVTADGSGGVIIAWQDWRNNASTGPDIYAQRYDMGGNASWTADGVTVCSAVLSQEAPIAVSDGMGGAIVTWTDTRVNNQTGYLDVYAQHVDGSGNMLWTPDGQAVCKEANSQWVDAIVSDGAGGAIPVWNDERNTSTKSDIYAQRIERNGFWGYPAPWIRSIRDVPGDQGGKVNLSWDASRLDPWPEQLIFYYSIWRAIPPAAASAAMEHGATLMGDGIDLSFASKTPVIRVEERAGQTYYWDMVDTRSAYYLPSYSALEYTLFDSTSVTGEPHYWQIIAHASDPTIFWVSDPDSGYSVDNFAPTAPQALSGEQSMAPDGLILTWRQNWEADLSHYVVYRGTSADFVPGPHNQIAAPGDTVLFDSEWHWDSGFYYKVAAVDVHENESPYALLGPETVTGIDGKASPPVNSLSQNYPNPFNPVTTIRYSVAERAHVKLAIYDASGRLVRVLVEGVQDPMVTASAIWDGTNSRGEPVASGVYFYRLDIGAFGDTRKMVLLR
jgi:hypothetical protein